MYTPPGRKEESSAIVRRAAAWLLSTAPRGTEEKSFQLQGLAWAGVDRAEIARRASRLADEQRADGGRGQLEDLPSDAYATGQALVALARAGGLAIESATYRNGAAFLLKTQHEDGSWLVISRARGTLPYFESGFPHGANQFTSAAGRRDGQQTRCSCRCRRRCAPGRGAWNVDADVGNASPSFFDAVAEREPADRDRFFAAECAADDELRREVSRCWPTKHAGPARPAMLEAAAVVLDGPARSAARRAARPVAASIDGREPGMGQVLPATDIRLQRTVAVKLLPKTFANDPHWRRGFRTRGACDRLPVASDIWHVARRRT